MNSLKQVMSELKKLGSDQTRKTFARHGAPSDSMFGVKVGDLKKLFKLLNPLPTRAAKSGRAFDIRFRSDPFSKRPVSSRKSSNSPENGLEIGLWGGLGKPGAFSRSVEKFSNRP